MSFHTIALITEAGIARLTLKRADKLNSFNATMHAELRDALDQVQSDKSMRVLLLTGSGRAFCAGQDLSESAMQARPGQVPDLGDWVEAHYKPLIMQLVNLRIPTIAAVNGVAAGAGVALALACDLVIACQSSSFLLAFSKIGLIPDTGTTWLLTRALGLPRSMALAYLGEKLSAQQAAQWGLIWQCIADEEFPTQVEALTQKIAQMPSKALVRTRALMHSVSSHTLEQQLTMEATFMRELGHSADYAEGVAAFLAKRPANFKGE